MSMRTALVGLGLLVLLGGCDGTLTGIGRTPREPEAPLPAAAPVGSAGTPTPGGVSGPQEPAQIAAQHLLVSYAGARGASSKITRSRDEARARAQEALDRIRAGADFDQVVSAYTDEPGGAARRGDLGRFSRDQMVKAFSDAAFALKAGQTSGVVESPFGFHVIRRTE